ncbi:MAG: TRAP transporter substrate-binding protein DctP, partial [Thiohalobacterales bacterium]|nr:TRAP transporter substrate-binding protein DctP [Thiohalobacterales bacterium]
MRIVRFHYVGLVAFMLLASACARLPTEMRYYPEGPDAGLTRFWPDLPEVPRYQYAGQLTGEQNFGAAERSEPGAGEKLLRWIVGLGPGSRDTARVLTRPQSGMVDAFYAPPLVAATFQWFGPARHMTALPVAPVVGAVIVRSDSLERIPEQLRDQLLATFAELADTLNTEMVGLEHEALEAMARQGLEIHPVPPEAAERWRGIVGEAINVVLGRIIPREPYDLIAAMVTDP